MAKATLRRLLFLGAMTGLTVTVSACGPDDEAQEQAGSLLTEAPMAPGWSMTDLAGADPGLLGGNLFELPRALPMQAAWTGRYDPAPAFDYAPDRDGYYEPLDESYYAETSDADDYLWLALAAGLAGVLGESPPDYAFGYDGVQPWAWETGDRYVRYAEPVYGGYRYYYYAPDTYRPFFVSDPYYSYGYRDDRLVMVYDRQGRVVDGTRAWRQRLAAREYYSRGEHLFRAGRKHEHFGVPARLWDDHRGRIRDHLGGWDEARRDRGDWQRWDTRHEQRLRRDWAGEALVRRKAEADFASWQKADYRTPPPKFYTAENRREQVRTIARIRRGQENGLRTERLALIPHRDQGRDRAQRERLERPGNSQFASRTDRQSGERSTRAGIAGERAKDRRAEPRRMADRAPRIEHAVQRRERAPQAEVRGQHAEGRQPVPARTIRAAERRDQAREVRQQRNQQQAQRADRQRQGARHAEVRRDRTRQQASRQSVGLQQARQEQASRVQAQSRQPLNRQQTPQRVARPAQNQQVRQAERRSRQRQLARPDAPQRAATASRQQAGRHQQQGRIERKAQRQQVRQADTRSQPQQARREARQARQDRQDQRRWQ